MRGTRGYELSKGARAQRPAVEGIRIAGQDVKYVRGSDVYLTAQFGSASRAVPINPTQVDGDWLYEGRIGYNGSRDRITRLESQSYGPASVEALVATVRPGLEDGQVLCIRPHSKKPEVAQREAQLQKRRRVKN